MALLRVLLLLGGLRLPPTLGLLQEPPTIYEGPPGSYFGFALDFHRSEGSVAVGAPRANTSQPGVAQPGAVFLCSWPPDRTPCHPLPIDTAGDESESQGTLELRTYKSHQWLGASVTSWEGNLVVCAPLQHWNALEGQHEAFRTPTGTCFVRSPERAVWYSPCRDRTMASTYRQTTHDKRYCEIGFSAAVTAVRGDGGARGTRAPWGDRGVPSSPRPLCPWHPPVPSSPFPGGFVLRAHGGNGRCRWGRVRAGTVPPPPWRHPGVLPRAWHSAGCPRPPNPRSLTLTPLRHRRDDLLVGAPLFMARRSDGQRSELGRLYLYLGRGQQRLAGPPQTLTGTHPYGRFGAAIASLGDLDKDGFGDVAVGAPQGGDGGSGQVFIFRGHSEGLAPVPTQRLESPFPGPAAGFALRGATDLDGNGYADLLVGAHGAAKVAVYLGLPVVVARTQLSVPDGLNPEILDCSLPNSSVPVSCATSRSPPELEAELQLDRLKPRASRRVLLCHLPPSPQCPLSTLHCPKSPLCHVPSGPSTSPIPPWDVPPCPLLSPVTRSPPPHPGWGGPPVPSLSLPRPLPVPWQTHIILEDCGDDNLCVPDLHLAADTQRLLIGAEAVLSLRANATNAGEGAFEAELRVQLPPGTHYQAARSSIPGQEKLSCNPKKENGTHVVLCELGNPMKAGARVRGQRGPCCACHPLGLVTHLALSSAVPRSPKNSPSPSHGSVAVTVPVEAEAEMELRGNSLPATMVLPTSWHGAQGSRRPEDHGIRVEHVYELHNKGPGTVSGVTLSLAVPHLLGEHVLLYLLELGTEGGTNCSQHPALNPAQVGAAGPCPPGALGHVREVVSPLCPLPAGDLRSDGRSARERQPAPGAPGGGAAPGSGAGGPGAGGARPCGERGTLGTCRLRWRQGWGCPHPLGDPGDLQPTAGTGLGVSPEVGIPQHPPCWTPPSGL
uniref:Integrin alpha-2 domain-containing protein n=1 Tax=Geospiza parvula TaxID=87175 RepID=A0A8C3NAH8_GEOPR